LLKIEVSRHTPELLTGGPGMDGDRSVMETPADNDPGSTLESEVNQQAGGSKSPGSLSDECDWLLNDNLHPLRSKVRAWHGDGGRGG
jgi:hypothetical protein